MQTDGKQLVITCSSLVASRQFLFMFCIGRVDETSMEVACFGELAVSNMWSRADPLLVVPRQFLLRLYSKRVDAH
jgi:hypothetical protein